MKARIGMTVLALWVGVIGIAPAQTPAPPANSPVVLRSPSELDEIVAPIALYPDPLLAELLPASTYPADIVLADRFVLAGSDPALIDEQPWDYSVKAMARYPDVLKWMDDNLSWTIVLGQAFMNQPQDVMDSIQRLRARAQATGNLQATQGINLISEDGMLEILPSEPETIYVPTYESTVVYIHMKKPVSWRGPYKVGGWLNHDCDWQNRRVIVWSQNCPRPTGWWSYGPRERYVFGEVHPRTWHRREHNGSKSRESQHQVDEASSSSETAQPQSTVHVIPAGSGGSAHGNGHSSVTSIHSSGGGTQHSGSSSHSQGSSTSRDPTSTQHPNTR